MIDLKEKGKLQNMDISYCLFCLVLCSPCWDLLKWSYYHCYGALVSNKVLRREDNIPVFSAKGCSFETDVPKLSSKIRRETTLNLSTVKGGDIEYLRWALPEKSEVMRWLWRSSESKKPCFTQPRRGLLDHRQNSNWEYWANCWSETDPQDIYIRSVIVVQISLHRESTGYCARSQNYENHF